MKTKRNNYLRGGKKRKHAFSRSRADKKLLFYYCDMITHCVTKRMLKAEFL